jgi:predicted phosphate transport protein (TIGR00153 family)
MDKSAQAAEKLHFFMLAVIGRDWSQAEILRNEISMLEHEADDLKQELRLHLPKGLFMPMPREDLLELLAAQDKIANRAKDIAGLILGRQMEIPASLSDSIIHFLDRCIDATRQAHKAINELDDLLETGFHGRELRIMESMIVELNKIEHDTDDMQVEIRRHIFTLEKTLSAIDAVFLYKIIEWIGDLADRAQSTGGRLQILLAR